MEDIKDFLDTFPELRDLINENAEKIHALREQIEGLRKDPGPRPAYKPSWAPKFSPEARHAYHKAILENQIADIINDHKLRTEIYLKNVDPKYQPRVDQYFFEEIQKRKELSDQKKEAATPKEKPTAFLSISDQLKGSLPLSKLLRESEHASAKENIPDRGLPRISLAENLKNSLWSSNVSKSAEFSSERDEITLSKSSGLDNQPTRDRNLE